jgi:hypothetical protein
MATRLTTGVCHSRSAPPVHMKKLIPTQEITPYQWLLPNGGRGGPRSGAGKSVDFTGYWRTPKKRPQRRGASWSRHLGAMPGAARHDSRTGQAANRSLSGLVGSLNVAGMTA